MKRYNWTIDDNLFWRHWKCYLIRNFHGKNSVLHVIHLFYIIQLKISRCLQIIMCSLAKYVYTCVQGLMFFIPTHRKDAIMYHVLRLLSQKLRELPVIPVAGRKRLERFKSSLPNERYKTRGKSFIMKLFIVAKMKVVGSGLSQLRRLTHICVSKLGHHWFRTCTSPCLYLDQCWCSVNWIVGNKLWSIWSQTTRKFIPEYEYEIRACENCENLYPAIICLQDCSRAVDVKRNLKHCTKWVYEFMHHIIKSAVKR